MSRLVSSRIGTVSPFHREFEKIEPRIKVFVVGVDCANQGVVEIDVEMQFLVQNHFGIFSHFGRAGSKVGSRKFGTRKNWSSCNVSKL